MLFSLPQRIQVSKKGYAVIKGLAYSIAKGWWLEAACPGAEGMQGKV